MARKVFIDCGGHDGCSVIKFLLVHPAFECVTLEPNSTFRSYYRALPSKLIESAAWIYDGTIRLLLDPIDGDGSTVITTKQVDATKSLKNSECPEVEVPCVDLASFILKETSLDDYVVLKLDVEGAEYAILPRLVETGAIQRISELFVEFHWERCGFPQEDHDQIVAMLDRYVQPLKWDARDYAVHGGNLFLRLKRSLLVAAIRIQQWIVRWGPSPRAE